MTLILLICLASHLPTSSDQSRELARNLEIGTQFSDSENAQHNLEIPRLHAKYVRRPMASIHKKRLHGQGKVGSTIQWLKGESIFSKVNISPMKTSTSVYLGQQLSTRMYYR